MRAIAWVGAGIIGMFFYLSIFWGIPLAAFNSQWVQQHPEAMGCTFWQFVIGFHILCAVIVWGAFGVVYLTTRGCKA